jgi:hypothetical protein
MSDFVTRLESELHRAAVRQEQAGRLRSTALPRLRVGLPGLAAAATAAVGIVLAVAAVAVFLGSDAQRPAHPDVPVELRGAWRLATPVELHVEPITAELHFYAGGSSRCTELGTGSQPCYEIDSSQYGALEWGTFSMAADRITFRARLLTYCVAEDPCAGLPTGTTAPGVYRWRAQDGALHLTKRHDEVAARAQAFGAGPLTQAGAPPPTTEVPTTWTARRFTSALYAYSVRYPRQWSVLPATGPMPEDALTIDTSDTVDRFSSDPHGVGVPLLLIGAQAVPRGTTAQDWATQIGDHVEESGGCTSSGARGASVDNEPATITLYSECNRRHTQWATFVHDGRSYQVSWWGEPGRAQVDAPLFDELLGTFRFSG